MEESFPFADVAQVLNRLLLQNRGKPLSTAERDVLEGIWNGEKYEDMALHLHKGAASLKQTAYSLWKYLDTIFGVKVRKGNFRSVLQDYLAHQSTTFFPPQPLPPEPKPTAKIKNSIDLGGLNCTPKGLVGREREVEELFQEIQSGCQLLLLTGSLRIGKTRLAGKLVHKLAGKTGLEAIFDCVLYRRASEVPTLADWYRDFAQLIDEIPEASSTDAASQVRLIMRVLEQQRCLLIFDQVDVLYQKQELAGQFQDSSAGYSTLLRRVAEDNHRSCLIWVGRTAPNMLIEVNSNVSHYLVDGLPYTDAIALLEEQIQNDRSAKEWQRLVEFCGGNPRFIQAAELEIDRGYYRSARQFTADPMLLSDPFHRLLGEIFASLSAPEVTLLYWLILDPQANQHLSEIIPSSSFTRTELVNAFRSLGRRNLLSGDASQHRIQPPILATYITQRLVESLAQEVRDATPNLLHQYPILFVNASADRVAQQRATLVSPLINRLCEEYGSNYDALYVGLKRVLQTVKQEDGRVRSYATGNLLNIASQFNLATSIYLKLLAKLDFSGLTIREADLQYTNLQNVSFANCTFRGARFSPGLRGALLADWDADGSTLAVVDAAGHCLFWQLQPVGAELVHLYSLPQNIDAIAVGPLNLLAVATGKPTISLWDKGGSSKSLAIPPADSSDSAAVKRLCLSPDGERLAASLADGRLLVWQLSSDANSLTVLEGEIPGICNLAFSEDGKHLAGLTETDQLWIWALHSSTPSELCLLPEATQCRAFTWHRDNIRVATCHQNQIRLQQISASGTVDECGDAAIAVEGNVQTLAFSPDGQYLAASMADASLKIWNLDQQTIQIQRSIDLPTVPATLRLSRDGTRLLTSTPSYVWLWDTATARCVWEVRAIPNELLLYENCDLRGVDLPPSVHAIAADLGAII